MKTVGVIGVGRLGICTALILEEAGFDVVCYDVSKSIRESITSRQIVTSEKGVAAMLEKAKNIHAVDTLEGVLGLDVLFCIVATPSLPDGSYDHKYINGVVDELIQKIPKDQSSRILFNICCTTMPGYSDTVQKRFDDAKVPVDVCYNPEFIAQGDVLHGFTHPDIILIGEANVASGDILTSIYSTFIKTTPAVCRMTRKEAELTKISINCFITTKISFANTIGDLCVHEGLNADRVLKAIGSDSRIGRKYLNWGHGYGGPCFPRDNRALSLYSKGLGIQNQIGEATDSKNQSHLEFLTERLSHLARSSGKKLLFRDLAFKPGTNILEESQTFALAKALDVRGFPIFVQESSEIQNELETHSKGQFLFVDSSIDISEYILVDAKLSCIRDSFE
jgi:nucleotide sugar dehydrogenase